MEEGIKQIPWKRVCSLMWSKFDIKIKHKTCYGRYFLLNKDGKITLTETLTLNLRLKPNLEKPFSRCTPLD